MDWSLRNKSCFNIDTWNKLTTTRGRTRPWARLCDHCKTQLLVMLGLSPTSSPTSPISSSTPLVLMRHFRGEIFTEGWRKSLSGSHSGGSDLSGVVGTTLSLWRKKSLNRELKGFLSLRSNFFSSEAEPMSRLRPLPESANNFSRSLDILFLKKRCFASWSWWIGKKSRRSMANETNVDDYDNSWFITNNKFI